MVNNNDELLTDLAAQVGQHTKSIAEHGTLISEMAPKVDDLKEQVTELGTTLQAVADKLGRAEDEPPSEADPIAWHQLDQELARIAWDRLVTWADEVLCPVYEITREQLPDCWTRHPAMRNELSWLYTLHVQAYLPGAPGSQAAEWHLRHLDGALGRIKAHAERPPLREQRCTGGRCRGSYVGEYEPGKLPDLKGVTSRNYWDLEAIERDIANRPEPAEPLTVDD